MRCAATLYGVDYDLHSRHKIYGVSSSVAVSTRGIWDRETVRFQNENSLENKAIAIRKRGCYYYDQLGVLPLWFFVKKLLAVTGGGSIGEYAQ